MPSITAATMSKPGVTIFEEKRVERNTLWKRDRDLDRDRKRETERRERGRETRNRGGGDVVATYITAATMLKPRVTSSARPLRGKKEGER